MMTAPLRSFRPSRSSRPLLLGAGVVLFTCASGWWNWMPSAQAGTRVSMQDAGDEDKLPEIKDMPQLSVSGTARVEKPADEVRISAGVQTEAEDARTALRRNTERMNAVIEALQKAGLTEDEYETGQFRIRPEYDRRPRNASADWEPRIVGYTVSNSLDIATRDLETIGELIAAANDAGANTVSIQGFTLSDPDQYRPEVITAATQRAMIDARALAAAADLTLVRILRIEADAPDTHGRLERGMAMSAARSADSSPPIEAGDVTLTATVRLVYEVRSTDGADG